MSGADEGPGAALKSAREALGVTVREVADALNLPVHVVEAMEANEFDRLPQPVFARGYLRSYAKLLELDPNAVVAGLPKPSEEPQLSEPATPANARSAWIREHPGAVLGVGLLVVVAVVLVLVLWLASGSEGPDAEPAAAGEPEATGALTEASRPATNAEAATGLPTSEAQSAEAEPPPQSTLAAGDTQAPGASLEQPVEVLPPSPSEPPTPSTGLVTDAGNVASTGVQQDEPSLRPEPTAAEQLSGSTPTAPAGARRITPAGDDLLELSFSEDCWVEIKDLDGNKLFSELGRAGTTRRLVGQAPFRLLLGYAPGVGVTLNGEPVSVERHTRNNVASLVLGE